MTQPAEATTTTDEQPPRDERTWNIGRAVLLVGIIGLVIGAVLFGGRTIVLTDQKDQATEQVGKSEASKNDVSDRVLALCAGANAEQLAKYNSVGVCRSAADAKSAVPAVPVEVPEVPFTIVQRAVQAYLERFPPPPGKDAPPVDRAVLLDLTRQVYAESPPAAGPAGKDAPPPTDEYLLGLINQVLAANPPAPGRDGADGRNAFCFDNPTDAACQPRTGAQGISVTDVLIQDNQGSCDLVVVFFNPADGATTSTRRPLANPALCGPAAPPTSTTSAPPPLETTTTEPTG